MSFVPAHQQEPLKAEKTGGCDGPDIHFEKTGTQNVKPDSDLPSLMRRNVVRF